MSEKCHFRTLHRRKSDAAGNAHRVAPDVVVAGTRGRALEQKRSVRLLVLQGTER
jgi:hypothetical protein